MGSRTVTAEEPPYGFILVTADPLRSSEEREGRAIDLVEARLRSKQWPIYSRTRNRRRFSSGARVAFYVSGAKASGGTIVATAVVSGIQARRPGSRGPDPDEFVTERPTLILDLGGIAPIDPPIRFRDKLPTLQIKPKNLQKWGVLFMGGSLALSARDWRTLFGA